MSRTYRKSRDNEKYMEGQYGNLRVYKCNCDYCNSTIKKRLEDKFYNELIKNEIVG